MNYKDLQKHPTDRVLRQFAAASSVILAVAAAKNWHNETNPHLSLLCLLIIVPVAILGYLRPKSFSLIFNTLLWITFPLGWVATQIVVAIMFYIILTPLAILFRLKGRDILQIKQPGSDTATFWKRQNEAKSSESYFRQY